MCFQRHPFAEAEKTFSLALKETERDSICHRYDHIRLPASGGAAAPVPPPMASAALLSPRPAPEHSAPATKSKLRESGKREKKTLVLRDRSE